MAHGLAAYYFGDNTAKNAGRLTMNPVPHIDIVGSILLPMISVVSLGGAIIGWAKPVPYNPYNLRRPKLGEVVVSAAGVVTNFILAIIFALAHNILVSKGFSGSPLTTLLEVGVLMNLSLGFFNLLPLPPFDGMRILTSIFPKYGRKLSRYVDSQGIVFMLVSLFIAFQLWGFLFKHVVFISDILLK